MRLLLGVDRRLVALALTLLVALPAGCLGAAGPPPAAGEPDDACPGGRRASAPAGLALENVEAASWTPWFVEPASVMPAPPPVADTLLEAQELRRIVEASTDADVAAAKRWSEGPATAAWTNEFLRLVPLHVTNEGKGNVPRLARSMALLETGMHDALVAAYAAKLCYQRAPPEDAPLSPSYPSEHAAVAGAASLLLAAAFPNETARIGPLAREAADSRLTLGLNYRSDVEAGFVLGQAVARAILTERADDGLDAPWDGASRPHGVCDWREVPPLFDQPTEPLWGHVRPFLLPTGDAFQPPPPPACGSDEARAQMQALYDASFVLTDEERDAAHGWAGGQGTVSPPGMWLETALAQARLRGLGSAETARVMSHVAISLADAGIAAWDAKYTYWSERPVTAIQRDIDPDWEPIVETPPFPGYVSGHSTFSAAAAVVLGHFFPEAQDEFDALAHEAMMSRFWGGIHIMADNEQGYLLGEQVGALVVVRVGS